MESVPCRGSRFESVVAYIKSVDDLHLFSGIVEGSISKKMKGKEWGFDPIFIPLGSTQTYAEMGIEAKQKLSHRRAAIERLAIWMTRKVSKR
jgi:XTP/dITP diphosphohydrolase